MDVHEYYSNTNLIKRVKNPSFLLYGIEQGNKTGLVEELQTLMSLIKATPGVFGAILSLADEKYEDSSTHLIRVKYNEIADITKVGSLLTKVRLDIQMRYQVVLQLESSYSALVLPGNNHFKWEPQSLYAFGNLTRKRALTKSTILPSLTQAVSDKVFLDSSPTAIKSIEESEDFTRLYLRDELPFNIDKNRVFEIKMHNWFKEGTFPLIDIGIAGHKNASAIIRSIYGSTKEIFNEFEEAAVLSFLIVENDDISELISKQSQRKKY